MGKKTLNQSTETFIGSNQAMKDTVRILQDSEFLDFGMWWENMVHFKEELY